VPHPAAEWSFMNDTVKTESRATIIGANYHGTTLCAAASRISTTNGTALSLFEKSLDNPNNEKLIKAVLSSGHRSVMEHCFFNIAFNNVSAFIEQYIIEFRLASFTVQSRRYVDFSTVRFFVSQSFSEKIGKIYTEHMDALISTYGELLALDVPKEDARFVLPYCFHSNFYCTCNARELLHMICTMIYGKGSAFEEIRTLGMQLAAEFEAYFPGQIETFKNKYKTEHERSLSWISSLESKECGSPSPLPASVSLLSHTTLPYEDIIGAAAFNFACAENESERSDINDLLFSTRSRELELINLCFRINSISLSAITHLVRHRMQSVLVPCVGNAVYSNNYVLPASVRDNPRALEIYVNAFERNTQVFKKLLDMGMDRQYAVYFALSGNTLDVIASMNGRELVHYIQLRTCNRAQWEIRDIATDMLKLSRSAYPKVFSRLGPTCFMKGACPEGKKTCGEMASVKERFESL